MSAIAFFHRFSETDLPRLRRAAVPARRFLREPRDEFSDVVRDRGETVLSFDGSGFIFVTLLPVLEEKYGIDLMKSSHDELARFLSEKRASTFFVLTPAHRDQYLRSLDAEAFDEAALREYWNEFNAAHEPMAGKAMLPGIEALHTALAAVREGSVVLLHIA